MSYEHYLGYPRSSLSHQPRGILSSDCSTSYQNYQSTLDSLNTPFYQQQQLLPGQQENMHPLGYSGWTGVQQEQQVAQPNTLNYNCRNQQQEVFSGQQEMVPIGNAPGAVEQQINPINNFGTVLAVQRNNYQNPFPGQQENMDPLGCSGMAGQQQNYSNQMGSSMNHGQQPENNEDPLAEFFPGLSQEAEQRSAHETVQQEEYPVDQPMSQAQQPQQYFDVNDQNTGGFAGYNDHVVQQQPSLVHNNQQVNEYSDADLMFVQNVIDYGMPGGHADEDEEDEEDEEQYSPFGDLKNLSTYEWQTNQRQKLFDINRPPFTPSFVDISLANQAMWLKYHKHGNEMMVINTGRVLFPFIGFNFANMNPNAEYVIGVKLLQSEEKFLYKEGAWVATKKAKVVEKETNEVYSIPRSGAELMEKGLVFDRLKIYNIGQDSRKSKAAKSPEQQKEEEKAKKKRAREMLLVIPRHYYHPLVSVYEVAPTGGMTDVRNKCFDETAFMVVTEYKNEKIKAKKGVQGKWNREDVRRKYKGVAGEEDE